MHTSNMLAQFIYYFLYAFFMADCLVLANELVCFSLERLFFPHPDFLTCL